jgi:flagellar hook-length control protein FliK
MNADQGQPIRTIAGTSLDAAPAKANPAPTTDSILTSALDALASGAPAASPVPDPALVASAAPVALAAPAAGDGRVVAISAPLQAIASGGDTLLGRVITRAMNADAQSSASAADTPAGAQAGRAANGATATGVFTLHPQPNANGAANALDDFLTAFASAARSDVSLATATTAAGVDVPRTESTHGDGVTAPLPPVSAQPPQTVPPFAIAIAHESTVVAPVAPAPAAQPQPVDANAVVDQMLRGMAIRTTDGQSEVRLRLVPENLGDVSVKLVVSGGSVDASITAHTADAQTALAGGQNQLAKTLADAGLKLQSFTVGLAGDFAGSRDQSRPNDAWNRPASRRIGGVESVNADEPDDASLLAVPSFGPPIYTASPALRNLNYLV